MKEGKIPQNIRNSISLNQINESLRRWREFHKRGFASGNCDNEPLPAFRARTFTDEEKRILTFLRPAPGLACTATMK